MSIPTTFLLPGFRTMRALRHGSGRLLLCVWCSFAFAAPVPTGTWEHALSAYQPPKYGKDFRHFEYVNPDAPKGGLLRLGNPDRRTSIDKLNPYTIKGVAPAALAM